MFSSSRSSGACYQKLEDKHITVCSWKRFKMVTSDQFTQTATHMMMMIIYVGVSLQHYLFIRFSKKPFKQHYSEMHQLMWTVLVRWFSLPWLLVADTAIGAETAGQMFICCPQGRSSTSSPQWSYFSTMKSGHSVTIWDTLTVWNGEMEFILIRWHTVISTIAGKWSGTLNTSHQIAFGLLHLVSDVYWLSFLVEVCWWKISSRNWKWDVNVCLVKQLLSC